MKYTLLNEADENMISADVNQQALGKAVRKQSESISVTLDSSDLRHEFMGVRGSKGQQIILASNLGSMTFQIQKGEVREDASQKGQGHKVIKSSMPGKVLKVLCGVGATVEVGQPLLLIEAMKMENEIRSPISGVVEKVHVEPQKKVETGELLLTIGSGAKG